jgi:hypothetical protein
VGDDGGDRGRVDDSVMPMPRLGALVCLVCLAAPLCLVSPGCSNTPLVVLGDRDAGADLDGDAGAVSTLAFGVPRPLSPTFSDYGVLDLSLTDDELELVFAVGDFFVARRSSLDGAWSEPVPIGELSSTHIDTDPRISGDGLRIVFTSYRDTPEGDLYYATRDDRTPGTPWSTPVRMVEVSSSAHDCCTSFGDDTDALYLSSDRAGSFDVYHSARDPAGVWSAPVPVSELNTTADDYVGHYRTDVFLLDRVSAAGDRDIVATTPTGPGTFGPVAPVGGVNGPREDRDAWLSADGRRLYFSSDRDGAFDIYLAER